MTKNTDSDRIAYPAFPDPLTSSDMVRLFTPSSVEVDWACGVTRSEPTRFQVLTLLKVFQTLGRFIPPTEIPPRVVKHVAQCIGLAKANSDGLSSSRPTLYRHQHLIREYVGVFR